MLEFIDRHKWALSGVLGVILLTLFSVAAFQSWRLNVATEERKAAEVEVVKAAAIAEAKQAALDEITKISVQQIEAANAMIMQMQQAVVDSQRREAAAVRAREQVIQDRTGAMNSVRHEGDIGLATSTAQVAAVLFEEPNVQVISTVNGFNLNREAAEVYKKALIEVASRRESETQLEQVADERARQIDQLQSVIEESDKKYLALEMRMQTIEERLNAVVNERDAYKVLSERFEKELEAARKVNFWQSWKGRAVSIGVFIGGIVIGGAVSK